MKLTTYRDYIKLSDVVKCVRKDHSITYNDVEYTIWKRHTTRWQRVEMIVKLLKWLIEHNHR